MCQGMKCFTPPAAAAAQTPAARLTPYQAFCGASGTTWIPHTGSQSSSACFKHISLISSNGSSLKFLCWDQTASCDNPLAVIQLTGISQAELPQPQELKIRGLFAHVLC